jgi:hypothetical protein
LIHAQADGSERERHFGSPLRRLRALYADGPWHDERAPLELQVDDLQGHRVLEIEDAGPLTDIPLPAGTYQVSVHLGRVRRSYTMTLEEGASFDLHLRLTPGPQ